MSKREYNKKQIQELERNTNIKKVSRKSITYTQEFKERAVKESKEGMSVREIFLENGFKEDLFDRNYMSTMISKWKRKYKETGSLEDDRGRCLGGGRPRIREKETRKMVSDMSVEIALLKEEIELLKKLREINEEVTRDKNSK